MLKLITNTKDLNEYEKEYKKISYAKLIDRICDNMILCNNIPEIDNNIWDNIEVGSVYNEETGDFDEIYQYFIIDITDYTLEKLKQLDCKDVIIAYSKVLENYILLVDHYGTSWDYVLTNIGYTLDYKEADI